MNPSPRLSAAVASLTLAAVLAVPWAVPLAAPAAADRPQAAARNDAPAAARNDAPAAFRNDARDARPAVERRGPSAGDPTPEPATDRFIVKFRDRAVLGPAGRQTAYGRTARELGVSVRELRSTATGARVVGTGRPLDAAAAGAFAAELEANPAVEYAEPDRMLRHAAAAPNDEYYALQWGLFDELSGLQVPEAWANAAAGTPAGDPARGRGVVVAVVDTGITAHSDLDANVLPGYDMVSDAAIARDGGARDSDARDEGDWYRTHECGYGIPAQASSWHGTHVAGIIAARAGNGTGVAGVAPNAKILPVRALGACGGYASDIADSIVWAAGGTVPGAPANPTPARVVNLSLGGDGACDATTQAAIDTAVGAGAAVVVAAGNEDRDAKGSTPANCRGVIAVAASGREGARAGYSNYGAAVDVTAPGGDFATGDYSGIASTMNLGSARPGPEGYSFGEGTSMAAPFVAGAAALLFAAEPALTPAQVEARLKLTARPLSAPCAPGCGAGLVDAGAALRHGTGTGAPPPRGTQPLSPGSPVIRGTVAVGRTVTADSGDWRPAAQQGFSYQWYRDDAEIPGAASAAYRPVPADAGTSLSVTVAGARTGYLPSSSASRPALVAAGTLSAPRPALAGVQRVGHTLTANPGTWTAGTALRYQWYRGATAIRGATARTHKTTGLDAGRWMSVRVTGTKTGYATRWVRSAPTAALARGVLRGPAPTVAGTAKVGYRLTANPGTWTAGTTLRYQWYRGSTALPGATARTHPVSGYDAGKSLAVRVTGTKTGYATLARRSAATPTVSRGTLAASVPTVAGIPRVGHRLTADHGAWTPGTTLRYQWYRSGRAIGGATAKTYRLVSADRRDALRVRVTGTRTGYATAWRYSPPTAAVR
ncbi:S8 family serine peptidase [Arthrobacter halodurans]|uniref:S8 family serine peptidase n=1 Tax=Arthrobacter halodurans TaxID=516699 RepID=A0ABV4UMZ5_9MICC